ncbi:uncharacterized protein [Gossypium hirsutum]|uniref:Uncharacterized protein n=1 Tax=Gossypium hirsutum TaxID=3635 RepID=A0A1U8PPT7_GOSHI|nr:uncharacterized protein LOC107960522 [Gossypium hirsutum]
MAPYEALYGRRCRTPCCWTDLGELQVLGPEFVVDNEDKVRIIRDRLKKASDKQISYAELKQIEVRPDLTFEEEPVQILDRDVNVLRRKSVPLVKVLWCNHGKEKATWEPEKAMRQ